MRPPSLDVPEESQPILRLVLEGGMMRGFEVRQRLNLDQRQLAERVRPLIDERLIMASGSVCAETVDRVHFAPLPSAAENARSIFR